MPSAHHQTKLDVPTAEMQRFQSAHLGASEKTKQPSGTARRSAATYIQEVKSRPKRRVSSISSAGFLVSRKPMT